MTASLYNQLCEQTHADIDRRGWAHTDCPACGKPAQRGQSHFSFNEEFGHCFVCGFSGSLTAIAELLNIEPDERARPVQRPTRPDQPRQWQRRPEYWLDRYCGTLNRVQAWQAYKPLSLESIGRFRLGVGKLPASRCGYPRLILPVFDTTGRCVAFHGRAYVPQDTEAKWLSAGGSSKQVLFNLAAVRPGSDVTICENFVDAILVQQCYPEVIAVAGGGASWQDAWTQQLAERRPRAILVLLDNDLVGWGNPETIAALSAQWRRERPGVAVPEPRGPKIATALLAAGVRTVRGPNWPRGTPPRWDIGSELMRGWIPS